jgi:hypothetical protein
MLLAVGLPAFAQRGDLGSGQWEVYKEWANPGKDGPTGQFVVGRFASFDEADTCRARLDRSEYDWAHFVRQVGADSSPRLPHWLEIFNSARQVVEEYQFWQEFRENPLAALARRNEVPRPLDDYAQNVADAYQRAKILKEGLLRTTKKITDKEFAEVNRRIDEYNRTLSRAQAGSQPGGIAKGPKIAAVPKPGVLTKLPRMAPVTDETIKKAEPWRQAAKKETELTVKRDKMMAERDRLDKERQALIEQRRRLQDKPDPTAEAERVRRVRQYLADKDKFKADLADYTKRTNDYSYQVASLQPRRETAVGLTAGRPGTEEGAKSGDAVGLYVVWGKQYSGSSSEIGRYATLQEARRAMIRNSGERTARQFKV